MNPVKKVILTLSHVTLFIFSFDISGSKLLQTHLTDILYHVEEITENYQVFSFKYLHSRHTDLLTTTGYTILDCMKYHPYCRKFK